MPVIVTTVPPAIGPERRRDARDGRRRPRYVNALASVAALTIGVRHASRQPAPAACAGVVAVIVVALTTVTPVAAVPPTRHRGAGSEVGAGDRDDRAARDRTGRRRDARDGRRRAEIGERRWSACRSGCRRSSPSRPPAPAACAGVVAVIVVALTTVTPVAAVPPIVTVAPAAKFVPVIVD